MKQCCGSGAGSGQIQNFLAGSGSGKNHAGFEMNLKYNYYEKLIQYDNLSTKLLNLEV
jgi:hypothetical protein